MSALQGGLGQTNTRVRYLYRDAANNTQAGQEVFAGVITDEERQRIAARLDDGLYFIAEQVGLANLRDEWPTPTDDDHVWHELDAASAFELTRDPPTRLESVAEFAARFAAAEWDEAAAIERLERQATEGAT